MGSEKPSFLSQPVVKNIFMFRNGDPYYEARRIVVNERRVCNFETLLREVTGGIQAPFGAVRTIYTPRGGHKVDSMESLQSGEQYVAAGRERFKRLDYLQIGSRKKRMMQTVAMQTKPLPTNRISVSARFLKPIKEPCPIFVVANGDIMNPAMRLLIHQRMLGQFDRILELITEKMGLRVLGGVRSLYTSEGLQVTDGEKLESAQLYVAVGRERFKKLPYSDLLFTKPRGTRMIRGRKTYSLPPIYRYSKQSGNSKSEAPSSNSEDPDSKTSPLGVSNSSKEHLSSIVREISQSKLLSLRKRKSGQSFNPCPYDDDDSEPKVNGGNSDYKIQQDQEAVEELDGDVKATEENSGKEETQNTQEEEVPLTNGDEKEDLEVKDDPETKDEEENSDEKNPQNETMEENRDEEVKTIEDPEKVGEKNGHTSENTTEEDKLPSNEGEGERPEEGGKQMEEELKEADEPSDQSRGGGAAAAAEEKEEEVDAQQKSEVTDEREEEINSKEQRSRSANSDKTQGNKSDGSHGHSGVEEEQGGNQDEDKQEPGSGDREERSNDHVNDVNTGEQKEIKNSNDPERVQSANESKNDASSIVNGNQQEASEETGESQEGEGNGEGTADEDEVEREAQLDRKNSAAKTSQ